MIKFFLPLYLTLTPLLLLNASYTLKEGKLINTEYAATFSVQEHYSAILQAYQQEQWDLR